METRANFAIIGALVLTAAMAVVGAVLWLSQSQFNREYDFYDMVFDGPVQLEDGASVRFNGIQVGEVVDVAIDRNDDTKVRARVRVDAQTPIRVDSKARIDFFGITGATIVQIQTGMPGSPRLERRPGEPVPEIPTEPNALATLFSGSSDIVANAQDTVRRVNILLSNQNLETATKTLSNIEALTAQLARADGLLAQLDATLAAVEGAGADFNRVSDSIVTLTAETEAQIAALGGEAQALLTDLRAVAERADGLLIAGTDTARSAQTMIDGPTVAAVEEVRLLAQDLRLLTVRLDGVLREIEANPQSFLVGDQLPYEGDSR